MPPPLLTVPSSSTASSDADASNDKALAAESANSSNDLLVTGHLSTNSPKQPATPLPQSVTPPAYVQHAETTTESHDHPPENQSVLDQHEEDITQFLNNYTVASRVIDQFDVTQALIQNQAARGKTTHYYYSLFLNLSWGTQS